MLVTVAEGALPVAVDAEVDVEVEEFGVWVVSDDVVAGGEVAVSGTAEVELELEVDVDDGEVVDVDVEDVVEDVVDEDVEVEDEGVEGVICGRAIYSGDLDFEKAQERADELNG